MSTWSTTETDTYTEARAKIVMNSVLDDFISLKYRGFVTEARILSWRNDILYLLDKRALSFFELQFKSKDTLGTGVPKGYKYTVSTDGSYITNDRSGGIDVYAYPKETTVTFFISLNPNSVNYQSAYAELTINRGYGSNGSSLEGTLTRDKMYSSNGFGMKRESII